MTIMGALLEDIDAFLADARIAEATFGTRAVNDGKFVARIRDGGNTTVSTIDKVRAYIAAERAKHPEWKRADAKPRRRAA